jgi:hypothetical protein
LGQKSLRRNELRQKDFSRFLAISAQRKRAKFETPKPLFWREANSLRLSVTLSSLLSRFLLFAFLFFFDRESAKARRSAQINCLHRYAQA